MDVICLDVSGVYVSVWGAQVFCWVLAVMSIWMAKCVQVWWCLGA